MMPLPANRFIPQLRIDLAGAIEAGANPAALQEVLGTLEAAEAASLAQAQRVLAAINANSTPPVASPVASPVAPPPVAPPVESPANQSRRRYAAESLPEPPPAVRMATAAYREDSDPLVFIAQNLPLPANRRRSTRQGRDRVPCSAR